MRYFLVILASGLLLGCGGRGGQAFGEGILQGLDPAAYQQYKQEQYQRQMLDLQRQQLLQQQLLFQQQQRQQLLQQPTFRPPLHCTSTRIGYQVFTNCY